MNQILILLFILSFSQAFGSERLPVYLTWQRDPTTTMTVQWLSDPKETESTVEYQKVTEKGDGPWLKAEGRCQALPHEANHNIHVTELVQLEPQSLYRFKIKSTGEEGRFRTLANSLSEPLRFAVGGDVFPDEKHLYEGMCKQVASHNPSFVVLGGDLAYSVSEKRQRKDDFHRWLSFLHIWSSHMKDKTGCMIPLIVTIGNHEVLGYYDQTPEQAPFFYALFAMPGKQGYNVLRCGDLFSLMLLDSGHSHPIGGAQSAWLEQELKKQIKTVHRFAIYHVPAYPSVRYFRIAHSSSIRRHWVPLFERYGLHAAFENHDHAYKRTHPLRDESRDPRGVVYFGDGSWGTKPRIPKKADRTTYLAKTKSCQQFVEVTLTNDARSYRAISIDGEVIDQYEQKVER